MPKHSNQSDGVELLDDVHRWTASPKESFFFFVFYLLADN